MTESMLKNNTYRILSIMLGSATLFSFPGPYACIGKLKIYRREKNAWKNHNILTTVLASEERGQMGTGCESRKTKNLPMIF